MFEDLTLSELGERLDDVIDDISDVEERLKKLPPGCTDYCSGSGLCELCRLTEEYEALLDCKEALEEAIEEYE